MRVPDQVFLRDPSSPVRIVRYQARNLRNHSHFAYNTESSVIVISGKNGTGKTNLLEGLSLFYPGKGLRKAELRSIVKDGNPESCVMDLVLQRGRLFHQLETQLSYDPATSHTKRIYTIDHKAETSSKSCLTLLRQLWLTPDHDRLLYGPSSDRRSFLDQLVISMDPDHAKRLSDYKKLIKLRMEALSTHREDALWLQTVEHNIAATGIALLSSRFETIERLNLFIQNHKHLGPNSPTATLSCKGGIDELIRDVPAVQAEETYAEKLRESRAFDRHTGRTSVGPHTSDLYVWHNEKHLPASLASTGEQKVLVIGILLAHAQLVYEVCGTSPILLLDELFAHLDESRKRDICAMVNTISSQVWITGVETEHAALFGKKCLHIHFHS